MINSLLNAAKIDSLLLTIVIILCVVIAGALIVYLLWEVVMSVARKNKKGQAAEELHFDEPVKMKNKKSDLVVADYTLDQEKVVEEVAVEPAVVVDAEKMTDVDEVKAEEEKAQLENDTAAQEKENAERRAYLEARRQELLRRMQVETEEEPEEEAEEEAEVEEKPEPQEEVVAEKIAVMEEVQEKTKVEEVEEKAEEIEAEKDAETQQHLEEERKALEIEKERYAAMVRELEAAKKILTEQTRIQAEKEPVVEKVVEKVVETVVTNESALSLEEIKEKLALAEERLKATEKEFKQCKKEYIPLKRVWSAYEKDQKKLRRKEALVAKQKVILYGVNNYADIDPEKANKLAEDLDLLDGLKLSVQHCEEVMKNNEERYPLLEKMYNVLKLRNDELKKDIATYKAEIERIESENAEENESEE